MHILCECLGQAIEFASTDVTYSFKLLEHMAFRDQQRSQRGQLGGKVRSLICLINRFS